MAGNKHKNGIICMFPGCEKKMRTQKFKGHFVKSHLREAEEYTVDHRRQFEIAQTEPLMETSSATAAATMDMMNIVKVNGEAAKRSSLNIAKKVATESMDAMMASVATTPTAAAYIVPTATRPMDDNQTAMIPPQLPQMPSPLRLKRPAAAMAAEVAAPPAPSLADAVNADDSMTLMKLAVLMDRRFNELNNKMDEIMEAQRLLFSAVVSKDFGAEEHAAKKRKEAASVCM